jgi:hypothetical protein
VAAPSLEQLLADWRERIAALRHTGHVQEAKLAESICDEVSGCMTEYLTWLSESEAMLYEGRLTADGLRSRFTELEARGLAKWDGRQRRRYYHRIALRHRGCPEAARAAGRRAGQGVA